MELRSAPARRAGLAALVALLVLGATACSGGNGLVGPAPAATVNGVEISQDEVSAVVEANAEFYRYSIDEGFDGDGSGAAFLESLDESGPDAISTETASEVLSSLIVDEVLRQELEEHDALPTDEDRDAVRSEAEQGVGEGASLDDFPKAYIDRYVERRAISQAYLRWLAAEADRDAVALTPEEREAQMRAMAEERAETSPLCLNAIQAGSEDEAAQARARVDGGEDFVAVATDLAPDGTQIPEGGAVACLSVDAATQSFGEDFSGVAVGDVLGPLTYADPQGGDPIYLVVRVESTTGQTYEELLPELEQAIPAEPVPTDPAEIDATEPFAQLLADADIDVNAVFGRWSPAAQGVVPPRVPGEPVTTTAPLPTGS